MVHAIIDARKSQKRHEMKMPLDVRQKSATWT
jgi:hypothetical protein